MLNIYLKCLRDPAIVIGVVLILCMVASSGIRHFSFDASADTLVVENDPSLISYREMSALFGGDDFIVVTYSSDDVLSEVSLREIAAIQEQVQQLDDVSGTYSILDAPLIQSPPIPLESIAENYNTLRNKDVDKELARQELTNSPLMSDYLIASNAKTTAITAMLDLTQETEREIYVSKREALINSLREIRDDYKGEARIFISGVPMIAADMLSYIRSDLIIFGSMAMVLIVTLLTYFFRRAIWVFIPLAICLASISSTLGVLGLVNTPVTVVSSNFVSFLAIISISFSIHLIVRYQELFKEGGDHRAAVTETMRSKFLPCLFTALTTILAFGSMLSSGIGPIIDFGWMMCLGIVIALMLTYFFFPSVLLLFGPIKSSKHSYRTIALVDSLRALSTKRAGWVAATGGILILPALYGLTLLSYDNRFIDYFSDDTDIHQGMAQIDRHLGGTLPLDVYIRFEAFETGEDEFLDGFEETYPERYWFTPEKIALLNKMQQELEKRPEIGKVISMASMEQMARQFNNGEALSGLEIAYVLGELPSQVHEFLIQPYAHPQEGWMRLNARIRESVIGFSKGELIAAIETFARDGLGLKPDEIRVTGMVVLFNDMLQQLAESQARTLGYVVAATFIMFSLLLRSWKLALIALTPNVLAAMLIVSLMGYVGIVMDMMTITIAAICIGIGVDNAIHYLHRFNNELDAGVSIETAIMRAHQTIGRAVSYTTITIMGGFSILAFSNFIPTVYFGVLTAIAMGLALVANMTLLPSLLMIFHRRTAS